MKDQDSIAELSYGHDVTEKTPSRGFDLAKLSAPLELETEAFGRIMISVRNTSFLAWLEAGEKTSAWPDGPTFVRAFLKERSTAADAASGPAGEDSLKLDAGLEDGLVDALPDAALEQIAADILLRATPYWNWARPKATATGKATPDIDTDIPPASAALLTRALLYVDDHRRRMKEIIERTSNPIEKYLEQEKRTQRLLGSIGTVATEQARRHDFLEGPAGKLARAAAALDRFGETSALARASAALSTFDDRQSELARFKESLTYVPRSIAGSGIDLWLEKNSILAQSASARLDWSNRLNDLLGLNIHRSVAEALSGLGPIREIERYGDELAGLIRPGFQTVATLALDGEVAHGAASDILNDYDLGRPGPGEAFAAAIACVSMLDDPEASDAERTRRLQAFISLAAAACRENPNRLGLTAILAIITLIVTIANGIPSWLPVMDPPDPAPEIIEATKAMKALEAEVIAQRREMKEDRSRLRYVHAPSPLRTEPHRGGWRIRTVYPDQWVEVREVEGEWAKVLVFDYHSTEEITGWINRRNLHHRPN